MNEITLTALRPLILDFALALGGLMIFLMDLAMPPGRKRSLGAVSAALCFSLLLLSFFVDTSGSALYGAYQGGPWALFFKRVAFLAGGLFCMGSLDHVDRHFAERQGEFYFLALSTLLGMTLLPGARDLMLLVVCFELMGIPLSVLASYAKTEDKKGPGRHAAEAGMKLFLVSAASTAITLYGLSLVYGMTATTKIEAIASATRTPLLAVGVLMTLAGMSFKVGAVPFHMWIPDTYQGAPTPFVAFLSVAPKATGFAALCVLFLRAFRGHRVDGWFPLLLAIVVVSVVLGNLLALPQKDLKRLLGYSGIAQVGYMLMALLTGGEYGTAMLLFYVAGYVATNMGAFFVLEAVSVGKDGVTLDDVDGLARRSPRMALALLLFLLSLAGIPFVVGFWAKLYVFMAVYEAGLGWLVLFGALMAIVALFYYLQIARAAYMNPPRTSEPLVVDRSLEAAVIVCLLLVVAMGAYPRPFLDMAMSASKALFFG
ncbi:MAG: NADH-quinone oxidoreductase subunit N [Deltaproteobacteria bacterium]|nr:NADH-quinone oxidoreductase subunit N [Deltaproteobacteria bacterium]